MAILSTLKKMLFKLHFIAGLAMLFFVVLMVLEDDQTVRALLLVPVAVLYTASRILLSADNAATTSEIIERYKASKQ